MIAEATTKLALKIEPLTPENFKPFGQVIDKNQAEFFYINNGGTKRYHRLADTDTLDQGGNSIISLFESKAKSMPFRIEMVERHPLGSQAFIPINGIPFLVVVAQPGESPQIEDLHAFYSDGTQGVSYNKNVWHHPVIALDDDLLQVVVDRVGDGNNCDEYFFDKTLYVELDAPSA
ncbi:ureidoglycolate lyase [Vibrio sp. SS-MA-C1-2]|uniref:ureidoglycolate lyase n=1 Tax=Vibrio sp. SS-MA-C1-2 TaxID=2908646 RepID=UPI001F331543|nr:ureidoglycolate lyase [Vibrio sp. SS-MA-C1-2]UJF17831.1 ureidoglycolate lyase [Vibrio sp. SS-MA-C1-2]